MSVIVKGGGGKSSGLYVWAKYNADIGLGESINNIALANDGTSIDTYVEENLYIKEDGTIGVQGEPYSTVSISSVVEDTCIGGMTPTKYCIGVDGNVYSSPLSHIAGSVDNCLANLVKVVKSTFIDFVVSDSETAYPDGAVHTDGYWYEKSGSKVFIDGVRYKQDLDLVSKFIDLNISTLPYDFDNGCAVVLDGVIHILGGTNSLKKHYKFDGSSWVSVSTLPYNFENGSAVVLNNEIHILGGDNASSTYKKHYKWNGSKWTSVSTLPYDFYFGSAVVLNNEIHILDSNSSASSGYFKWDGTAWSKVSNLPYSYDSGLAVVFNNEIHILGGHTEHSTKHYKWDGSSWTEVSTLPYSYKSASAVVLENEIHMLGGNINFPQNHYKFDGSAWTRVSDLPDRFIGGKAVVLNNEINILSGNTAATNHYAINVRVYREVA